MNAFTDESMTQAMTDPDFDFAPHRCAVNVFGDTASVMLTLTIDEIAGYIYYLSIQRYSQEGGQVMKQTADKIIDTLFGNKWYVQETASPSFEGKVQHFVAVSK